MFSADIEVNKKIHNEWDTTSFPTIYYVRNGERKQYSESRSTVNLMKFIRLNEQDPVVEIEEGDLEDAVSSECEEQGPGTKYCSTLTGFSVFGIRPVSTVQ